MCVSRFNSKNDTKIRCLSSWIKQNSFKMTREDKCKLAISKGYIYDSITGKIYEVVVMKLP